MSTTHHPTPEQEATLLALLQRGDEAAMNTLLDLYMGRIYRFFCGMGMQTSVAEDLTQEAFVEIWRSLPSYEGRASLYGWMVSICRRIGWRHFKGGKTLPEHTLAKDSDAILSQVSHDTPDVEAQILLLDHNERVRAIVHQLPVRFREVVVLYYLEEMTKPMIADVLGVAEGTVKSRLHRALQMLRPKLSLLMSDDSDSSWSR